MKKFSLLERANGHIAQLKVVIEAERNKHVLVLIEKERQAESIRALIAEVNNPKPIPMRLPCPFCGALHVDEGEFASKPHHTHACQGCGGVWRPAVVPTVGVRFLPGFKNKEKTDG